VVTDRQVSHRAQALFCSRNADRRTGILKEFSIPMKRSLALAVALASGLALGAAAQTPPAPAAPSGPVRIAVIAFQAAVAQTNEGQRDFADLEKKYSPKEQQLKALNDEVESLTKQLQAQGDKLSEAARASQAKTIDDKKKKLDREAEDARNDFQQEMGEIYNSLASKVYDVMSTYAQQQGYTLILDVSQQQNPVLYANPATDISKPVIDAYNLKSGVPAPPAQPAASTAPSAPKPAAKPPVAH
jgi:outer membrane protein